MAKPKRTASQREEDLVRIAELYLTGTRQTDIAIKLGISQPQVSQDLKKLQARWAASAVRDLDTAKGQELAKIDELELVYWDRWRASQKRLRSKSVTTELLVFDEENKTHKGIKTESVKDGQKATLTKTVVTTTRRDGVTEWLNGIQWCIERRCKLLGIDAPSKVSLSGDILAEYVNVDFDKI